MKRQLHSGQRENKIWTLNRGAAEPRLVQGDGRNKSAE